MFEKVWKHTIMAGLLAVTGCTFPTAMSAHESYRAVTQGGDGPFVMQDSIFEHKAVPVMDGTFHVVIINEKNGRSAAWKQFSYITARECDRAIVGIDDALRAVANPDPEVVPKPPVHADPKLVDQVVSLLAAVIQNTGVVPSLSIACEADGI